MQIKTLYSYIRSRNDKYLQVTFFFLTHTYTHTLIASPNKKHPRRINNPVAGNTLTAQLVISKYSCPLKMILGKMLLLGLEQNIYKMNLGHLVDVWCYVWRQW